MRDRIWHELTTAKFNCEFLSLYETHQRLILKYFNTSILLFSSGGILGWPIWDKIPGIACAIVCAASLLKLLQPQLIMSEMQIINVSDIGQFYNNYYNKIERIWYDLEDGNIDSIKVKKELYKLKDEELAINPLINENIKSVPKRIVKKATIYTDIYIKVNFNTIKS
jgi:hypothetical protein